MERSDANVSLNVKESNARAMLLKAQAEQDLPWVVRRERMLPMTEDEKKMRIRKEDLVIRL